jgi:bifunctional non-homologous end joining protein LigD
MSLKKYKEKRKFNDTPEPKGKVVKHKKDLIFVVQKHDATRLHYDFRLELDGVLKSWAVPKGPSLNPDDKRLSMMVEDHPFDYKDFEGIIPKGNYGAGEVIVWDKGTYHSYYTDDRKESEKLLREGLEKGDLKFIVHGEKINGAYALVKIKSDEKNAWLLIKKKDEFVTTKDITKLDKSVVSGLTIEDLQEVSEEVGGRKKKSPEPKAAASKSRVRKASAKTSTARATKQTGKTPKKKTAKKKSL